MKAYRDGMKNLNLENFRVDLKQAGISDRNKSERGEIGNFQVTLSFLG